MRIKHFLFIFVPLVAILSRGIARADVASTEAPSSATSGLQASNLANPNISIIAWVQSEAGHRVRDVDTAKAFDLKEAELGFQSIVDPYARADFFISVHDDQISLEEGYLTLFTLPYGLSAKIGKFRANFGKFNRTHTGETAFADRPLVAKNYLGEEGLSGTGLSASWQIPIDLFFMNLDLETFNTPSATDTPAFNTAQKKDLTYLAHLSSFFDLSDTTNLTFGSSYVIGAAGQEFNAVDNSSSTLHNQIIGVDATFRWKNPARAIYRSAFWQTEVLWNRHDMGLGIHENTWGLFSHLDYQFLRRWHGGARWDYTEEPDNANLKDRGGLVYVTFLPSEFSLVSLQGKHTTFGNGTKEDLGFLKVTFNIGPHGAHPF